MTLFKDLALYEGPVVSIQVPEFYHTRWAIYYPCCCGPEQTVTLQRFTWWMTDVAAYLDIWMGTCPSCQTVYQTFAMRELVAPQRKELQNDRA